MVGYLVVGLLFLVVLVFAIMSWKQWHWTNSVFLILSFIAAVASVAGASKVLSLRTRAIAELEQSEVSRQKAEEAANIAIYGSLDRQDYGPESLRGVNEALTLELIGRGRTWQNGQVEAAANGSNKVFKFAAGEQAAEAGASELTGVVMYAFEVAWENDIAYPNLFLGTLRVVGQSPGQLELAPQFVVDQAAMDAGSTWTLYERMPGDRYDVFLKANNLERDGLTIAAYRELLTTQIFPADRLGMDPAGAAYEAFIDQFAFDGFTIGEIERYVEENSATRNSNRFQPSPEEVFVRFKFNAKSKREYKVDATGNVDVDGPFTLLGEAIDKTLHLGASVSFVKDQEVLVDQLTADGYQRYDQTQIPPFSQIEDVTEVGRIYRRKLNDFPVLFADFRREALDLAARAADVARNNAQTKLAQEDADNQVNVREEIISRLRQDNDNLKKDVALITTVLGERTNQLADIQSRIESLEQKIEMLRAMRSGAE